MGKRKDRINMEGTEVMERGKGLIFKVLRYSLNNN